MAVVALAVLPAVALAQVQVALAAASVAYSKKTRYLWALPWS
jgi:hypothetical protein